MKKKIFKLFFQLVVIGCIGSSVVWAGNLFGDFGDAPDGRFLGTMTAYAQPIIVHAHFPTIFDEVDEAVSQGPYHHDVKSIAYLGQGADKEWNPTQPLPTDNTNLIPAQDQADLDTQDDGINRIEGLEEGCSEVTIYYTVTIVTPEITPLYLNMWFDFNRDGDWEDSNACGAEIRQEWVVQEHPVPTMGQGTHTLAVTAQLPAINPKAKFNPMWMRATLSPKRNKIERPFDGSGPQAGYAFGETEDYLLIYRDDADPQAGWSG